MNREDNNNAVQSAEGKAITLNEAMAQAKSVPGMILPATDLVNQIPENERAVIAPDTEAVPSVTKVLDNLALEVPEDERAEAGEADELEEVRKLGVFEPTVGMANILDVLDNKVYARIYVDSDKVRYIEFCEQYSDGSFSPKMRAEQSSMLLAEKYNFIAKDVPEASLRNRISKFIFKMTEEYLGKYNGLDEALDIVEVLNVLLKVRGSLPVYETAPKELEPEQFYHQVMQTIKDNHLFWLDDHKAYYTLDDGQIRMVEKELSMKPNTLLPKLKNYGFLYLTDSCKGYQTNVRFKGADGESFTQWMYCIYKLEYFAKQRNREK